MRNRNALLLLAISLFSLSLLTGMAQTINVIPTPLEVKTGTGVFNLTADTKVSVKGKGADEVAAQFLAKVKRATGWTLKSGKNKNGTTVYFKLDKNVEGQEAYTLEVKPNEIVAAASTTDGLYYAMQTLLQLLPPQIEMEYTKTFHSDWEVPVVTINDKPRFTYRGVMLDPCRHFFPIEVVKQQIDRLSAYKINRIHWHLTDDQGWRIEIKKYPELLTAGAQRVEGDGSIHKGYYTQEEVKEVVAYAKAHHIEIVPEFEMPGHGLAAIAAYPWLSCAEDSITPRIIWGVEDIVFCPGKETTFKFLQDVIDEMVLLFPGKLFHIGGDESPRQEWAKCDSCQSLKKELGYNKDAQLQSYVVGRIGEYLASKGKQLIGWDEILEGGGLDTSAVVMSWRGEEGGIAAAKMNHHVLMTPSSRGFYFDTYQSDPATEPVAIGGYSTIERVYAYDPVPQQLRENGKEDYVLGVQANCWSEYMLSPLTLEYRLYPRALALSEVAWSALERKNYDDFIRRLDNDAALRLQAWNINFHVPQPEQVDGSLNKVAFTDSMSISLKTTRPMKIVYTTDGTLPTVNSTVYEEPIQISKSTTLRTASVLPCGIMSPVRTIEVEKQTLYPAVNVTDTLSGVNLSVYKGTYLNLYNLPTVPDYVQTVPDFSALRRQAKVPANVRNVDNYVAIAEGFIEVSADGVYEFSTNNHQLWIDTSLLVDNSNMTCPRYSPNNAQKALSKGLHRIKVAFIGGIFAGWPTYWDDASVKYRAVGSEWKKVDGNMLFTTAVKE